MMQFPCVLAYVIEAAAFEKRFQDLRTIFSENFIPDSFLQHSIHSLLTGLKFPNIAWTRPVQVLIELMNLLLKIPRTLSGYWNPLPSSMKNMSVYSQNDECRWNTADNFVTSLCEMNMLTRAIAKFIHLVIWHFANSVSMSNKPILGLTVTVIYVRRMCWRNCGFMRVSVGWRVWRETSKKLTVCCELFLSS